MYNALGFGTGVDRHTGMGLLNTKAAVDVASQTLSFASTSPVSHGHAFGVLDPNVDFDGIWVHGNFYFAVQEPTSLRIVLAWNRPVDKSLNCSPCEGLKPDLNMLLRDMDYPTSAVAYAHTWDPSEEFLVASVLPGKLYRLDIYKQNTWPGPMSVGLAAYTTNNPQ